MNRTSNPSSSTSGMTTGQRKVFDRLVQDIVAHCGKLAVDKIDADSEGWQLLLENGDELKRVTAEAFVAKARELSVPNQFANEEVPSNLDYPSEYKGPKPIVEQIKKIAKLFGLDPAQALKFAKTLPELPDGAEGWFAIPKIDALAAKRFPEVKDPGEQYCRAVELMLNIFEESHNFHNYRKGELTHNRFRQHARTVGALEQLGKDQPGDIVIVAAQFGRKFRGKSVRRARVLFKKNEFGLGAFAVGCMTLTHMDRFVRWEQLHTDCPGDEFSPDADGQFDRAPIFYWHDGQLKFDTCCFTHADGRYGSVSGVLPQAT